MKTKTNLRNRNKRSLSPNHPYHTLWKVEKIWDDCECFIIGGGYSIIRQFGLDPKLAPKTPEEYKAFGDFIKPHLKGYRVIGVNNAFMLGDWVDVAFWGDAGQYLKYKKQYDSFSGLKVSCHPNYEKKPIDGVRYVKRYRQRKTGLTNKRKFVIWNHNSGSASINFAYHLGAKKIYLLGFDMFNDSEYKRTHWHSGHPDPMNTVTVRDRNRGKTETIRKQKNPKQKNYKALYSRHMRGFKDMAEQAQILNLEITNFSPESKIEYIPKLPLAFLFPELVKDVPVEIKPERIGKALIEKAVEIYNEEVKEDYKESLDLDKLTEDELKGDPGDGVLSNKEDI